MAIRALLVNLCAIATVLLYFEVMGEHIHTSTPSLVVVEALISFFVGFTVSVALFFSIENFVRHKIIPKKDAKMFYFAIPSLFLAITTTFICLYNEPMIILLISNLIGFFMFREILKESQYIFGVLKF